MIKDLTKKLEIVREYVPEHFIENVVPGPIASINYTAVEGVSSDYYLG